MKTMVPKMGTKKWVVGAAVQAIQNSDPMIRGPPSKAGSILHSKGLVLFWAPMEPPRGRVRISMVEAVAAAKSVPAMAEVKAMPTCWTVKLYVNDRTTGMATKNWKMSAKMRPT